MNDWYLEMREKQLEQEVMRLRRRVEELEHQAYLQSWKDTMGGAFTRDEIERARNGGW